LIISLRALVDLSPCDVEKNSHFELFKAVVLFFLFIIPTHDNSKTTS
jgi:hypothetical protein